jgi:ribosomal protein S27AE
VLLTQHGKLEAVAAPFEARLAARVEAIDTFDTDTLGTFTRDIPRRGTQLEAARRKAHLAIELGGASIGLGSEGACIPGPFGLGAWNVEVVTLVDVGRGIEVVGYAAAPGLFDQETVTTWEALTAFAEHAAFPEHGLVLRPESCVSGPLHKGIRSWSALESAFRSAHATDPRGRVTVEHDLRAHQHPTRMRTIGDAAADLVTRLATPCPRCASPGFGVARHIPGLPCGACGQPTDLPKADEWACVACDHRDPRPHGGFADPGRCGTCNP